MADNTILNPGSGGDAVRNKDRGTAKTQIVALDLNPSGTETLMAGAMPVTGTFWQATQPVSGTFWQATQPVSATSLPLPTGAATAAKQPALGTAGTASADVLTVQGIAAMTALKVDGSGVTQPVSGTVTANAGTGTFTVSGTVTANAGTGTFAVSAASLPLPSGASTSAKQPALGTAGTAASDVITVQGIASMTPLAVSGSGTFAVSAASLPLPSGASTAAKQPALGTAGTASADVITVQGIAAMTALKVDGSGVTQPVSGTITANIGTSGSLALDATLTGGSQKSKLVDSAGTNVATVSAAGALKVDGSAVTQPVSGTITANIGTSGSLALDSSVTGLQVSQGSTTSGQKGGLAQGAVTTSAPTYTTGQTSPLSLDVAGNLRVNVAAGGGSGGTSSSFGSTFPATGTAIGAKDSTGANLAALNLDASGFLKVNVAAGGGSGGTSSSFGSADPATGTAAGYSDGTNMREARVFDLDSGAGTQYVQGVGLRLSASGGSVEAGTSVNPIRTDPTGTTTQPVSGTFWQATQPVSATSLPLPTGAATAAKQPALGTAGTASADVLTVQGIAAMTALKVDGSGVTQPVSGTVTANAGTGTFTVSGTVTANAGTGTFAVSAASLPLPSGASTSAKQPALGTAGTASADVLTVQGIAAMTALKVDGSGVTQPVSGTFWQATQPVSGTITANAGTGTFVVADNQVVTDNGGFTDGTTKLWMAGYILDDTAGTALTENDAAAPRISTNRATVCALEDGATRARYATVTATNALKVDGSAVTQPVSGTFWQATQPVSGTITAAQTTAANLNATVVGTGTFAVQATLQAGTALAGQVSASNETGTIYNGTTALTPKFAKIVASTSGVTTVVTAVATKKLRVLRWSLSSNGAVNVKWQSHVTPTDLTGLHYLTQFASAGGSYCPVGLFETVAGEALDINLSAAIAVGGELTYVEV